MVLFAFSSCKAQEKLTLRYLGHQYKETKNRSFVNDELIFMKDKDTLRINIKVPFDEKNKQITNRGIYYDCHLKEGVIYTISLKRMCVDNIPEVFNSYYQTNTISDKEDCAKFNEVKKHTEYNYTGNYGKYVDIDRVLYEIIEISPDDNCFLSH